MRALALPLLASFLLAGAAGAGTIRAPGTVRALGLSGTQTIFAADLGRLCREVAVYDNADHGVRRYAKHCWQQTSTGSGVASVAVAGSRALWLTYTGGNIREWSLWTKSRTSKIRRLQFVSADVDAAPPIVIGSSERHVVYSVGRDVVGLSPNGARAFTGRSPFAVTAISGSPAGYAVLLDGGDVAILSPAGRHVRTEELDGTGVRDAVALDGGALLVQTSSAFERRENEKTVDTHPVPRGARFLGYSAGVVAYGVGSQLRLLRLRDDRSVLYRTLVPTFSAHLDRRGIAYGSGRSLVFDSWATVAAALS